MLMRPQLRRLGLCSPPRLCHWVLPPCVVPMQVLRQMPPLSGSAAHAVSVASRAASTQSVADVAESPARSVAESPPRSVAGSGSARSIAESAPQSVADLDDEGSVEEAV